MTTDKKMLDLIEILKTIGMIRYDKDFADSIGMIKQHLTPIKAGKQHFTPAHIEKAIKVYKVNANWIFGVSDKIFLDVKFGKARPKEGASKTSSR